MLRVCIVIVQTLLTLICKEHYWEAWRMLVLAWRKAHQFEHHHQSLACISHSFHQPNQSSSEILGPTKCTSYEKTWRVQLSDWYNFETEIRFKENSGVYRILVM